MAQLRAALALRLLRHTPTEVEVPNDHGSDARWPLEPYPACGPSATLSAATGVRYTPGTDREHR